MKLEQEHYAGQELLWAPLRQSGGSDISQTDIKTAADLSLRNDVSYDPRGALEPLHSPTSPIDCAQNSSHCNSFLLDSTSCRVRDLEYRGSGLPLVISLSIQAPQPNQGTIQATNYATKLIN